MTIAVNCRLKKKEQPEGFPAYLFGLLKALSENFPEHQFLFIFDKNYDHKNTFPVNVLPVIAGPVTSTSLRLQYWFNFKIPSVLRKYKADVFVSLEGICSLRTKKPQCLLVSDLSFLQAEKEGRKSRAGFFKKYTASFLVKSKSIATVSEFSKNTIAGKFEIDPAEISVIEPGIDPVFKPLDWNEQELTREKYTEGKAYFLYSGTVDERSNTINLLKAFSFFKKRQRSNMMLVIAGKTDDVFRNELKTYKLRSAVILLENLANGELARITASAYAMIHPVLYADFAITPLQALACETPLIVSESGALPEIFGESALYSDPNKFEDIAEKMMLLFKNEDKASEMVISGKGLTNRFRWKNSAETLMRAIEKAYNS